MYASFRRAAVSKAAAEAQRNATRVCLVTGANRGIGLAIARGLAKLGPRYTVIVTARREADVDATVAALREEQLKVFGHVLDVSSSESVAALAAWIEAEVGVLHVLVNNAGILLDPELSILTFDEARVLQTFDVNCIGALRVTRALLPLMRRVRFGRIINMSSRTAQLTVPSGASMPGYRLSKIGMNMATHMLCAELQQSAVDGDDIIVASACPGMIATDMTLDALKKIGSPYVPTKGPEEGAKIALFLATLPAGAPNGRFWADNAPDVKW